MFSLLYTLIIHDDFYNRNVFMNSNLNKSHFLNLKNIRMVKSPVISIFQLLTKFLFTTKRIYILLDIGILTLCLSCKKKDNNNINNSTPTNVTTCFQDGQAGIYFGDGVENSVPFTASNVSITKLTCTSVKVQSSTSTYTINSLNASNVNDYTGSSNTSENAALSFTVNGAQYTVNIQIGNTFQFTGTK